MPLSNTGIDRFLTQNYYSKSQLNAGQLDSRYFAESEFVASSAGAGDAGKPVKLNGSGALDATLYAASMVTLTGVQTLTNKTLTSPNFGLSDWVIGVTGSDPLINFDSNDYISYNRSGNALNSVIGSTIITQVTASGLAVTGALPVSGAITSGGVAVVTTTGTQTLTNKTLTSPSLTSPTLTSPTLTSPVFSTIVNTGTLTLPTSTDTLVGRATTDTLTNKTLTTPTIGSFVNATHTHADSANGGLINHASLSNLTGDDHTVYARLAGRSGGQTLQGGTAANEDITIEGTAHATKTSSTVYLQPTGGTVGVGFSADPGQPFAVRKNNSAIYFSPYNGAVDEGVIFAYNPVTPGDIPLVLQGSYVRFSSIGTNRFQFIGTFTPTATADATGNEGDVAFDASYMYRKTAAGWKRAALSTF